MRRALLALAIALSIVGCGTETVVGPSADERALIPAEGSCNPNAQLC